MNHDNNDNNDVYKIYNMPLIDKQFQYNISKTI